MAEHLTHSRAAPVPEHHSSLSYWLVWGVLMILTVVTWVTGRMHLPTFGLALALIIASTKATLVVLFFMHLWEQRGVNRITLATTLVFVLVLFLGVFGDVTSRLSSALPQREAPLVEPGPGGHGR